MNTQTNTTATEAAYTGSIPNTPMKFMWYTARPYMGIGSIAVFGVLLGQISGSMQAYLVSAFVEQLLGATTLDEQVLVVSFWSFMFVGLLVALYAGWRISGYAGAAFISKQNVRATEDLYRHTVKHSHSYFSDRFAGSLSNQIAHASDGSSEMLLALLYDVARHSTSIIVSGILLSLVSIYLALGFFVVVFLALIVNYFLAKIRRPMVERYSESTTVLRGQIIDVVTNIQATRQYTQYQSEDSRISGFINDRMTKDLRQWRFSLHISVINNIMALSLVVAVLFVTYELLRAGETSPSSVILVVMATFAAAYSMQSIGEIFNKFVRFYGEVSEGLSEIFIDPEIVDIDQAQELQTRGGKIDWKQVTFEFGNNTVFDDFNLEIQPGQRVGLVGSSGAGKTTFVSLLLRQHDITNGAIEIDGQNIANVTQDSLRENIAVVPQEPLLFHRTIRDNIAYGKPDATDEEVIAVAQKAQAHDFIMLLEEGYDTLVGERGIKLSGGQKQRVAIARAMLKDAPILILDEATSALDSESEVEIQKALHILMEGKTVIAVAHRLSTLREMDRILVLETGKIIEDGPHDELAQSGGTYQKLWNHQAGGFLAE
jgi:ATP-binding cassette subfamily B protein